MTVPSVSEISIDVAPTTAEPVPAMAPSGCIASVVRFPNSRPMPKNDTIRYAISSESGGCPAAAAATPVKTIDTAKMPHSDHCDSGRIP